MLILHDFECSNGHVNEELVESGTDFILCKTCGETATRQITPVRFKLNGYDPGFPTAWDKWAKQHEKAGKAEPK